MSGLAPVAGVAIRNQEQGRLRHRKDFDAIFRRGRSWNNHLLVLRTLLNDLPHSRYGFVTSKRVGNAVARNRIRRRLKEVIRTLSLREGWDVVFSAKTSTADASFQQLRLAVVDLLTKADLLQKGTTGEGALS
ncbi:MAG: ribonuclease P protein component [Chloroflexi bacterium]|nr:ribonuclease P protein component [Chloroflexota bacterium]